MRTLVALCLWSSMTFASMAEQPRWWFVQITYDTSKIDWVNPDENPGRVELTSDGQFAGCAFAAYYRPSPQEIRLVPLNVGWLVRGERAKIKVETYGELGRLVKPFIKISEVAQP